MASLRMAVIGVGALGQHHARIVSQLPDVTLVAVADPRPEQGQKVATSAGTRWVANHRELIDEVDAVTIAVPTCLHVNVATDFLENGIHSLVEKPLAADLADAHRLVRMAERSGATLQVGHIERFNPAFQAASEICDSPKYIRAERLSPFSFRSTDIGVVHDMMIHDLDLVLALVRSPVIRVEALGLGLMSFHEDSVQARLTFANGCVADLAASRLHPSSRRTMTVWTESKCLAIDYGSRELTTYSPTPRLLFGQSPVAQAQLPGTDIEQLKREVFGTLIDVQTQTIPPQDALTAEISEFVHSVRSGETPTVSGHVALESLSIAERILEVLAAERALLKPPAATEMLRAA